MQILSFDTAAVPPEHRFAAFCAGAPGFRITTLGDPAAFAARWRLLKLGEVNAIHTHTSDTRYQREPAMIAADGEDRVTIHYYIRGGEVGTIDGRAVRIGAGEAMVWDLARPLDLRGTGPLEIVIITLPRYLVDEVLPAGPLSGPLPASAELALAAHQTLYLIDHAADLPQAGDAFYGRALRDMFAAAMLPPDCAPPPAAHENAPLFRRIVDRIDAHLCGEHTIDHIAQRLGVAPSEVAIVVDRCGGLPVLVERRRLLAAYRALRDPAETDTVSAIAHRCGFAALPQFSRRFAEVFHVSASDLRRFGKAHLPRWAGAYHVEESYRALLAASTPPPAPMPPSE